jgi:pilus assembly protein CpaF
MALNVESIHRQIAASMNLIVHEEQLLDGSRKITHITQVNGLKNHEAVLEDIFVYEQEGFDPEGRVVGRWKACGVVPFFYPEFKKSGIYLPEEIFMEK